MKKVRLGKSDLLVSRVGFGGIPIARVSFEEAERCIRTAIDLGVNFIDTAASYRDSEEKIGRAIKGCRDKLIIASKSLPSSPEVLAESIDQSLRRMQIDTIDLYQFHCIKDEETLKRAVDLIPVLEKAKDQGKIRHIGASVHGVDIIGGVLELDIFETVMIALNFIVCEAQAYVADAISRDIGVIAMKPLAGGHIEDAYLAFKYFIGMDNVVPLVGIDTCEQIEEIVKILDDDIGATDAELEKMELIRNVSGSHFCRRCGYCMPCEHGVKIMPITIFKSFAKRFSPEQLLTKERAETMASLENCVQCGECERKCPYDLDIQAMFKENIDCFNEACNKFK